jgi:hypothetical protein
MKRKARKEQNQLKKQSDEKEKIVEGGVSWFYKYFLQH